MEILGCQIYHLKLCWRGRIDIYGMSQVIGMVRADKVIERFISRWEVVPDDELLSITVLGEYFVIFKSSVNIVSPLR